jgi:hypothetical protein
VDPSPAGIQFPPDALARGQEDSEEHPTPAMPLSPRQKRVQAIEKAARGSVLGCILQPLLAVVSDSSVCTLQMANTMERHLSKLAELSAQVSGGAGIMH